MVTPDAKRKAVVHLMEVHQVSQRRACSALDVDRSTVRYQTRGSDDADLRDAMKAVAKERRRFGYRRLHVMVERQGWHVNHKKFRRITAKRNSKCAAGAVESGLWAREGRWLCQMVRTSVGASISYLMH